MTAWCGSFLDASSRVRRSCREGRRGACTCRCGRLGCLADPCHGWPPGMPVRRMEMARAEVGVDPVTAALVGWLVNRVATAGQRVLARWLGGDKQAKALRPV